jgi:hypothetical protein
MKTRGLFVFALLIGISLGAEDKSGYTPESRTVSETFTSKISKVYSFQDGDFEYVALVVDWKGHDVVITALPIGTANKRYEVGDTVRCMMSQMDSKVGGANKKRVMFSLLSSGTTLIPNPTPEDEIRRLEQIAAEVARRKALRDSEIFAPATPPKTPNR